MKPSLQLKLSQHLALTPQLQQSIKLLQLSTLELNQEIEKILLENPMLEREEPEGDLGSSRAEPPGPVAPAGSEAAHERDQEQSRDADREREPDQDFDNSGEAGEWMAAGSGNGQRDDDDDTDFQEFQAAVPSLRDHLDAQVALTPLSDRDRALVRFLIEALDDDGYLSQDLEDLLPLLPSELGFELDDLNIALRQIQSLDPAGIGATDVGQCLALQLRTLPPSEVRQLALAIVAEHLELLAARDFLKLKRALRCNDDSLREAHNLILGLNPRPGAQFSQADTRYVVPDVVVRKVRNAWVVGLNPDAMPRLRINQLYAQILRDNRGASGSLSSHLQEARWLIKNVQQRFETIQRVSQAIVDRQRQFFDYGDVAMRPLTLREIAEQLDLHESTVSRVTTQKYMATPRGIFEFKYFFGSHVATDSGGAASSTAIRALIRQLVGAEDKRKPLSDAKIAELLGQQGIVVARRTIAKYRESLDIPPVSLRKTI
ncbi:RNA polymerase factor sigma-54 [Zoogloea sp.]|jgi:RNA polymerase sigma-54 factor|uniref:RNA polymerase factor sigma-54 n=2 Tax=Zoogloea sp. TaxID=49181 RepID=UPI0011D3F1C0|nr:RNA polymerase factor sigma-54 [Zoogloea sp.]MBK6655279.1 RNA polymerase factor sigma-54 [Zoogloea sp.]MBP7445744.1 RNA polymerase factor sigma-54 [Zoogloea sp.]TXG95205.1 MAG: RNA polymerase factor sigma-54 [Zoogloea sp.]HOY00392.1 RNA polymerase factor sigma-54 [Zoogloea sp.]HPI59192.1 RNA polymerase factor sigma-54 [Zoogloea sp.]